MVRDGYSARRDGPPRPGRKDEQPPSIGATPALEAFRAAALGPAAQPSSGEDRRLTSLEMYTQNQVSELIYQQLLAKKEHSGIDAWYQEYVSEAWQKRNNLQKADIERQAKSCGENTPMWVEALSAGMELAAEVFEADKAEQLRTEVSRDVVLELLESLSSKLCISHYARCGLGQIGIRALVAVLWHFDTDAEVAGLCADSLRWAIAENEQNRNILLDLRITEPAGEKKGSLSFSRVAMGAFLFQAGGKMRSREGTTATEVLRDPAVAVKLAACLLAAGDAWLKLPQTGELSKEQLELRELVPEVLQSASALSDTLKGNQVLADFQQRLKR
ncbi:gbsA [Symbiodinium sp. CCMP2456]|nr:gbsA [Symbiodinium sp. CCMP2456]